MSNSKVRQYSLSDAPHKPYWRITVKRENDGQNTPAGRISSHLHTAVKTGDVLLVSAAFGTFTPPLTGDRPLALLSAGVGITPMVSVLNALASDDKRPILFAHAARDQAHHALREEVSQAQARLPKLTSLTWYEDVKGADPRVVRAGHMALSSDLVRPFQEADFYLCGPLEFMRAQWRSLVACGVSPERLHREVFGPESLDHLL